MERKNFKRLDYQSLSIKPGHEFMDIRPDEEYVRRWKNWREEAREKDKKNLEIVRAREAEKQLKDLNV